MKKLTLMSFVLLASLLVISVTAQAMPVEFENPPEYSGQTWETTYPHYQRSIYWDFASTPTGWPNLNGAPGAVYGGDDDPDLWDSDYVTLSGDVIWMDGDVTIGGVTRNGLIGIDNSQGSTALSGTATFHIDNHRRNWPLKHLYKEIVFADLGTAGVIAEKLGLDSGYSKTGYWPGDRIKQDAAFYLQNHWYEIKPNPYWEDVIFTFTVEPYSYAVIDSLHIATECIPEPTTMILLGSLATGLFGIAGVRKKFSH